jgi:hypothetical protein
MGATKWRVAHLRFLRGAPNGIARCFDANEHKTCPGIADDISAASSASAAITAGLRLDVVLAKRAGDIAKRLQSIGSVISPGVEVREVTIWAAYYTPDTGQVELLK